MPDQLSLPEPDSEAGRRHSARNIDRGGLRVGGYLTIQERFDEWLETPEGRSVYGLVRFRALALKARNWKHYSVKALVEAIRYDRDVKLGPTDGGFKINDHFSSRMARRVMAEVPELDGFFEVRVLREGGW
jgi:hypothetical protein